MDLKLELKEKLIDQLNLEEVKPEDIKDDEPLFGEGLGLDSIDALEIIVILDNNYNIKIGNPEEARDIFHSINTLATYIEANQK
ncbi:acyl carrier protein [Gilvimarinus agarilyticus]|uniref:Acyl carrier protein n=1 Tax=Reichenbachiella agariperforans TaxID=156994 RepID=A0A1M6PXD3_REIAG|nr:MULTISPECIES: phosphopantetheine-binding protein [Reichenbachiella]MBU2884838.1 acyl carrier protein [Gilvimarinus agarilyticus]MBU2913008.1 acyl carrier protein [Reichenbachiella agariperforans]RJE72877.1 acyl carrier protein [Reichenbachiella sp. MSK19-1]SHK12633.1 acyl carrier protein [Reichenbachiella agariperforans]